jgi:hypothetical protein
MFVRTVVTQHLRHRRMATTTQLTVWYHTIRKTKPTRAAAGDEAGAKSTTLTAVEGISEGEEAEVVIVVVVTEVEAEAVTVNTIATQCQGRHRQQEGLRHPNLPTQISLPLAETGDTPQGTKAMKTSF